MNRPILDDRFIDNVLNKILEDNLQKRINDLIDEETEKLYVEIQKYQKQFGGKE